MSKYTTQLRFYLETLAGYTESKGLNDVNDIIAAARPLIFNFDYSLYNAATKERFETKFLRHYYMREIGSETIGLFRFHLENKIKELAPVYEELYRTTASNYDPWIDTDYSITRSGTDSSTGSKTTSGTDSYTGNDWVYDSDTPQGGVSGVANRNYLSFARNQTAADSSTSSGSESTTGTGTHSETITHKGKTGGKSYGELLAEYRKNLINVDLMFINECEDLFMLIY